MTYVNNKGLKFQVTDQLSKRGKWELFIGRNNSLEKVATFTNKIQAECFCKWFERFVGQRDPDEDLGKAYK